MAIPGIPNSYKGRNYRSLLETRWAIMFEKLGWQAEYEPFELNGWIPDFILIGKEKSVLVEVKPFTHLEQYDSALEKIDKATKGTDYEYSDILLLGVNPGDFCEIWNQSISLGWLLEWAGDGWACAQARIWMWNPHGSEIYFGLGSDQHTFQDRMHDVDPYENDVLDSEMFKEMWADAGSQTQWKASSYSNAKALFNRKMTPIEKQEYRKEIAYAIDSDRIEREMREREKRLDLEEQLSTIKGDNK